MKQIQRPSQSDTAMGVRIAEIKHHIRQGDVAAWLSQTQAHKNSLSNLNSAQPAKPQPNQYLTHIPNFWYTDWLLHILDKPNGFLYTDADYLLSQNEWLRWQAGVLQMQAGTPLAYLTGEQAFWSLDFYVNEHTLIPRPDTEVLVEQVLAWIDSNQLNLQNSLSNNNAQIPSSQQPFKLLDLGTGSGCIAISLAYELAKKEHSWQITAVDYSQQALAVASKNAQRHGVGVQFMQGSWYAALLNQAQQQFQVIVSNPPYIDASDEHLSNLCAEPITALVADKAGLADIEAIVGDAPKYLCMDGLLAIEHGYNQGDAVRALMQQHGFSQCQTVQDYAGQDRVTLGIMTI